MTTLLLADDSVTVQRVIELTFADEGVRVISVGDGESAIARIDQERPDIVLADVGMPGVDGYQVASHVKRSPASANVPVLLLTGAFEPIDEERARETGCDGVLVKPFEPRQLIKTVRELLSGARPAELWPSDMPRLETAAPQPGMTPLFSASPTVAPAPRMPPSGPVAVSSSGAFPTPMPAHASARVTSSDDVPSQDGAILLSVPYDPEGDPDLAAVLARLEFVGAAGAPAMPGAPERPVPEVMAPVEGPRTPSLEWDLTSGALGGEPRPASGAANKSLANVFSALLAAERKNPEARTSTVASPSLSEAAVEEVVQKVVRRMTDELVRKIVLETAERLIREEIDRIKA